MNFLCNAFAIWQDNWRSKLDVGASKSKGEADDECNVDNIFDRVSGDGCAVTCA